MKVFPVVVIVLLAFATFFVSFLVAPLAVLTAFYLIYSMRPSPAAVAPQPETPPGPAWQAQSETEASTPPARRARITVVSHSAEPTVAGTATQTQGES
jgi:hypothetical protein